MFNICFRELKSIELMATIERLGQYIRQFIYVRSEYNLTYAQCIATESERYTLGLRYVWKFQQSVPTYIDVSKRF